MKTTTYRMSQITTVHDVPEPVIRSSKQWRRYQVMLKRLQAELDLSVYGALLGPFGAPPPPPRREPRGSCGYILDCLS